MKLLRIMKLIAILLTTTCLQVSAYTSAQVSFSLREAGLDRVFTEIEKQTGMPVLFNWPDLTGTKKVTLQFTNATYQQVLQKALEGQPLEYEVKDGKSIIIFRKKKTLESSIESGAKITIRGKLVNKSSEPIAGATIQVKGGTRVTTSNEKGEFLFENIDEAATLIITSVNYQRVEIKINGRSEITAQLEIRTIDLAEVNVTVSTGYQKVGYNKITGSVTKVDNALYNRSVSSDALSRLNGVASGVLFDRSIDNNIGISVRGKSTIFANSQPLIVIDNFPYSGDINSINPNDIESVTILKDASAASIWGAYSGNGVIVITTKKGSYNQPIKVEVNTNVTIREKPDLYYDQQFIKSSDFIDVEKYLFERGFYNDKIGNTVNYPVLSPVVEILERRRQGEIDEPTTTELLKQYASVDVRNQLSKYIYQKSITQQYSLNISGGNKQSNYYLSTGYDDNLPFEKGNKNKRITLNGFMSFKPAEFIEIYGGMNFIRSTNKRNALTSLTHGGDYGRLLPYTKLADEDGSPLSIPRDYNSTFVKNPPVKNLLSTAYTPLRELDLNNNTNTLTENRILVGLKFNIIKDLTADIKYQFQNTETKEKNIFSQELYYTRNLINSFSQIENNEVVSRNIQPGSILSQGNESLTAHDFRFQLNYTKKINQHSIIGLIGLDAQERKIDGNSSTLYGYDESTGTAQAVDYKSSFQLYPSYNYSIIPGSPQIKPYKLDRFRSYFGNIIYSLNDIYSISASARLDQSNLFGIKANQKRVPLWSAGFAWNITREPFFSISWVEQLKIRATYGFNGNLDRSITAIPTATYYNNGGLNNIPIAEINNPGNPELQWERIRMMNFGLDFTLANQLLSGSIEYFLKNGFDMIGDANLPSSSGFTAARGNYSNMKGKGIDLTLNFNPINKIFKWSSTILASFATDKITKNENEAMTLKIVGNAVNGLYTYQFAGLDNIGDPQGYLNGEVTKDYSSILNETATNPGAYHYSGSTIPRYFGSFRNTFSFKGLSISANILAKLSYYFKRSTISYSSLYNAGIAHSDYYRRWEKAGDENTTNIPSMQYVDYPNFSTREGFFTNSSALVEKGDHIRLQDVSIAYNAPSSLINKIKANSLQVYLYASNLGIIWRANNMNIDPDVINGFPNPKSIALGIRATF